MVHALCERVKGRHWPIVDALIDSGYPNHYVDSSGYRGGSHGLVRWTQVVVEQGGVSCQGQPTRWVAGPG